MTREERHQRWQEIFDNYDRAMAEYHDQMARTEAAGHDFTNIMEHLNYLMAKWDRQTVAARNMADATMAANRAALALYQENDQP